MYDTVNGKFHIPHHYGCLSIVNFLYSVTEDLLSIVKL
jgi:hypothetical protein